MVVLASILFVALVVALIVLHEQLSENGRLVRGLATEREAVSAARAEVRERAQYGVKKREAAEILGRRLASCERMRSELTEIAAGADEARRQTDMARAAHDISVQALLECRARERRMIAEVAKMRTEPDGRMFVELEVPERAYAELKRNVIENLGGTVYAARTHSDEMGG